MRLKIYLGVLLLILGSSCKIADLSKPTALSPEDSERIASQKIAEVIAAQGFDKMKEQNLYSLTVIDDWKGMLGKMAKLWPDPTTQFAFKYNFNTFDGNALFLSGEKEGDLIGVQSWQFYEHTKGNPKVENKDTGKKHNPMEFGIVALHYFIELPYRLQHAPIKRYYGEQKHNDKTYDLVFVSWGSEKANATFDQYVLWINTTSKLVEYCMYTIRDTTNFLTAHKYGSIAYLEYQEEEGFWYPTKLPVFIDDGVLHTSNLEAYFHQFRIQEFSFGGFAEAQLYPLPGFEKKIDTKH